jgi:putative ABC transport system permease protein
MRALDRKLVRDLWHVKGQALAIALVVGCGVAVLVMAVGTRESLFETRTAYYERYRFADLFAHVKRAPERLADRLARIPGVKWVDTRIVETVSLDVVGMAEPGTGRLVSIPERGRPVLNGLTIRRGRYIAPDRPDEVVISEAFSTAHGLGPGDHLFATINGHKRRLDVVGVALSPEYVYSIGPGFIVPDDKRFGVMWMGREALAATFDLDSAFNDVTLSLLRAASIPDVIQRLDAELEPYGGIGAYDREDQMSHAFLSNELDQLETMSVIIPPIFLAVAAFLLNIVVSRLIDTEREQIGLLKAFGYTNVAVGWHYMKFVLAITALGLLLGFLGGALLGRLLTELYAQFFHLPFLHYRLHPWVSAVAALVTVAAAATATLGAVRRAVRLAPAVAMQPAAPTAYRRIPFERRRPIAGLGQPTRMILRHILRWPVRAALTTLGIGMAGAILVSTLFFYDAIEHLTEVYFFQAQRQDVTVTFVEARPRHCPACWSWRASARCRCACATAPAPSACRSPRSPPTPASAERWTWRSARCRCRRKGWCCRASWRSSWAPAAATGSPSRCWKAGARCAKSPSLPSSRSTSASRPTCMATR